MLWKKKTIDRSKLPLSIKKIPQIRKCFSVTKILQVEYYTILIKPSDSTLTSETKLHGYYTMESFLTS